MVRVVILAADTQTTEIVQFNCWFFCFIRGPSEVRSQLADTKCYEPSSTVIRPFTTLCRPSRVTLFQTTTTTKHVVCQCMLEKHNQQPQSLAFGHFFQCILDTAKSLINLSRNKQFAHACPAPLFNETTILLKFVLKLNYPSYVLKCVGTETRGTSSSNIWSQRFSYFS